MRSVAPQGCEGHGPYSCPRAGTPRCPLAPLTTFRLGGPAAHLVTATTDAEVVATVRAADESGTPLLIIGGGSNLVIGDRGFDGTALRIATTGFTLDGATLELAAGENWSDAVARTVEAGLAGIECLAGIPGSAGATPIQNVGAYGQEVCDTITEVVAYDRTTGETVTLTAAECAFRYRNSTFKDQPDRYVVLRVRFALEDAGGLSAPIKYPETARALGVEAATGSPPPPLARRCCGCAPTRAWSSTPPTTTPGRPAPSSTTRS